MGDFLDSLVPIVAILSTTALPIGLGMYLVLRSTNTRHKERMELIKQGIVPPNDKAKPTPNRYRSLRNGILCIGIALGLIIGFFVTEAMNWDADKGLLIIVSSVLLFLGLAYTLFYLVTKNNKDLDDDIE